MNLRVRKMFSEYPTPYCIGVRIVVFARRGGGVCGCVFAIFLIVYLPADIMHESEASTMDPVLPNSTKLKTDFLFY